MHKRHVVSSGARSVPTADDGIGCSNHVHLSPNHNTTGTTRQPTLTNLDSRLLVALHHVGGHHLQSSGSNRGSPSSGSGSSTSSSSFGSNGHERSNDNILNEKTDRPLLLRITTILVCASVLLVVSAVAVALRHHQTGGPKAPNFSVFSSSSDFITNSWLVNYHPSETSSPLNNNKSSIDTDISATETNTKKIPKHLVFVTDRLPGDAKIDPHTLENAAIWQDLYKGHDGYKVRLVYELFEELITLSGVQTVFNYRTDTANFPFLT